MIITLEEAKKIYPSVTQDDIDGIEIAIRELTNNPFQNRKARFHELRFGSEKTVIVNQEVEGIRKGDTIQISGSKWNDGLYVVSEVSGNEITFEEARFFTGINRQAFVTKIDYPADIVAGVKKLLKYDSKMADKVGLKSETVSRMSKTYYDQNSTEIVAGYPAAMMSFVNKYRLLKW
ncbi:hypothetical protein [Enterococcus sp. AZ196]|uniref:hypothetical protein n=1 Tax=Enterococcus sp. AZ196 TaxID=2774659 RepID=UPI003D26D494